LQVLPSLAKAIGLNEAIFAQQLHYWLRGKSGKEHDGRRWIYNTREEWQEQFSFWSLAQITRTTASLKEQGVLLTTNSLNKSKMDRTLWYSLDYDRLDDLSKSQHGVTKSQHGVTTAKDDVLLAEDGSSENVRSYQETTHEITQETTHETALARDFKDSHPHLWVLGCDGVGSFIRVVGRGLWTDEAMNVSQWQAHRTSTSNRAAGK
ncbi:MAG: hypothetical protein M3Z19_10410, partial [Chloroflexota bacterium]|nr:hypothetical protein [Chloroflexota bacterium]